MPQAGTLEHNAKPTASPRSVGALEGELLHRLMYRPDFEPFLAAYLTASGWDARRVGLALTLSERFNLVRGALATAVGMGAALSNALGGMLLVRGGYSVSFLALGFVAVLAFGLLLAGVPETLRPPDSSPATAGTSP
jgi:hypothetical protein